MGSASHDTKVAARMLGALAQPSRLGALQALASAGPGGLRFAEMAVALGVTRANLAKQLRVLEADGLVTRREDAQGMVYIAQPAGLAALAAFLTGLARTLRFQAQPHRPSAPVPQAAQPRRRRGVAAAG